MEVKFTAEEAEVLETMRQRIAKEFGVTLMDNRVTVRWTHDGEMVDVTMEIREITTPSAAQDGNAEWERKAKLLKALYSRYPELEAELYYIEHGEYPQ